MLTGGRTYLPPLLLLIYCYSAAAAAAAETAHSAGSLLTPPIICSSHPTTTYEAFTKCCFGAVEKERRAKQFKKMFIEYIPGVKCEELDFFPASKIGKPYLRIISPA